MSLFLWLPAFIGVPSGAAISNPVCEDLLILLPTPNLDEIVPDTGFISDIPKLGLPPAVVKFVLTEPVDVYFTVELVF